MNESELASYCRTRGLFPEQIRQWRQACEEANEPQGARSKAPREVIHGDKKRIKELERELKRKDRALAETAALLVLRKKAQAIWGDEEE